MRLTPIAVTLALATTIAGHEARAQSLGFPIPAVLPLKAPENSAVRPGGRYGIYTTPRAVATAWATRVREAFADPARLSLGIGAFAFESETPEEQKTFEASGRTGIFGTYADIGLQLNVRFEVRADQFRNLACTSDELQNPLAGCAAKFPTISPNPQYSILSSGIIGQRLHVNVDFNSQREFDANNTIQVWYEGLPDEVLRRVEAGNVSFAVPASRFISAAVPANNFGFQAIAQVGDLQLRGIYAQQKGTVVKDRIYTVGQVTNQSVSRDGRDLDYEAGRFFFTIDPARIPGYPDVDILNLDQVALPADLRVGSLVVYRVRAVAPGSTTNQNIGGVKAVACGPSTARGGVQCTGSGAERAGPFQWQILTAGKDYYVDNSGAWFALASALDQNDYLAISYATQAGTDSVGTLPFTANPDTTRVDTLRLVYDPTPSVTAQSPAFRFEIRSVYRFGSGDLTRETAQFSITVNQRQRTVSSGQTYLQLLGLSVASNPTQFDQYNRLFPRTRDPANGAPLRDLYVVFPSLVPFADSTKLAPAERNDSLYRTPRAFLATQGPPSVFALHYQATAVASADRSTLSLNSFQIKDGSEKIFVGSTQLTRGTDYSIDYSTGTVTFLHPDSLFQNGLSQVRAQFEERTGFAVAPTSVYGLASEYSLGAVGRVDLTGIFQSQQSPFTRPPLGSEPSSSFIGGISTELHFQPMWLTDGISRIPGVHGEAPSFINLSAEMALSKPQPNSTGQAYLEEFEGQSGRFISMSDVNWQWGSIPTSTRGAEPFGFTGTFDPVSFSGGFDPRFAAFMTWQSLPVTLNADGSTSLVQFFPQQIDPEIVLTGATQTPEPVLWMMLKPDTVLGLAHTNNDSLNGRPNWVRPPTSAPRWRSITQTLSATGIDLTRVEYLEFWVWEDGKRIARANKTAVLFDFGSTFEDALAFVPDSFIVNGAGDTTYYGQRAVGLGKLDTERDPLTHAWSAELNDNGILSDRIADNIGILRMNDHQTLDSMPLCSAAVNGVVAQYFFGDLRSRCGRKNGAVDTEDQDGDFQLDSAVGVKTREDFVRFVFPIGSDKYYVRDGGMKADPAGGVAGWRLYRIPFRTDTLLQGTPNLRQVQTLRITVVAPDVSPPGTPEPQVFFALSRVQLVGATWLKRADTPIRGIAGQQGVLGGQVVASFVSTENRDLGYTPPPGVLNQAANQGAGLSLSSTQINEQSLRILASGLQKGQHAEAFNRFTTEGDKNLLRYKELRVWARGRGPGWDDGDLEFYIKVGKDENNFYMYHTPARTASWDPEVVAKFAPWIALRADLERKWLSGLPPQVYGACPDTSIVPNDSSYVECDGPYIVHIHDPATAPPNLAAVEELAAGILRVNDRTFIDQAELWVDDIRVSDVVTDVGMAGAIDLSVTASNLADLSFSLTRREANFAQLGEDPTYTTDNGVSLSGTLHLERFLPPALGLSLPFTYQYVTTSSQPFYLPGTDIQADQLRDLRTPLTIDRVLAIAVRRVRRSQAFLGRYFVDPFALSFNYVEGDARTSLSSASSSSFSYGLTYNLTLNPVRIPLLPRFLDRLRQRLLGGSPDGPTIRINPSVFTFASTYSGAQATQFSFPVSIREPSDAGIIPTAYWSRLWQNQGSLQFLPFAGVTMRLDGSQVRDLHDYGDSTAVGRLLLLQRQTLFGRDVGVETQRRISTFVGFTPLVALWMRPRLTFSGVFSLSRDPNASAVIQTPDSAFHLPLAFTNSQRIDVGTQFDPGRFARSTFGDSSLAARLLKHLASIDFTLTRSRGSSFAQAPGEPSTSYELGLGSLEAFRHQAGVEASSATQTTTGAANANADLLLGFRVTTTYQATTAISYVLRGILPAQVSSHARDWPNGTLSWSYSPSTGGLGLGRLLNGVTAQVNVRKHETSTLQPSVGNGADLPASISQATERVTAPSLALSWIHGVLTSADYSTDRQEQTSSGSLVRTTTSTSNAYIAFAFRPPQSIVKLPTDIRTNARYTVVKSSQCIQPVSIERCIPFVDTQQKQTQLSMDTDFPPTFSAGLQVAYILNAQKQLAQKTAQLTITAYVSLSTSVGQFR
ncbi:MAG TPA: cell surface protein SprA [Gemmatimonadales bacterium]|nr:cell surface protein SprA [Gemmatimonadales bacterium]